MEHYICPLHKLLINFSMFSQVSYIPINGIYFKLLKQLYFYNNIILHIYLQILHYACVVQELYNVWLHILVATEANTLVEFLGLAVFLGMQAIIILVW